MAVQIDAFDRSMSGQSALVRHAEQQWPVVDVLRALHRASLNDSLKGEIFAGTRHSIEVFLSSSSSLLEQEAAAELLAQLCFDPYVVKQMADEEPNKLNASVAGICNGEFEASKEQLITHCGSIQWLVHKHVADASGAPIQSRSMQATAPEEAHIMISYNSASRGKHRPAKPKPENKDSLDYFEFDLKQLLEPILNFMWSGPRKSKTDVN